jgi:prepilin-type N-terminal cleavage/methylation domain-containing protein
MKNQRGLTLTELLVTLAMTGFLTTGAYQMAIRQGRTYSAQDQIMDVQQGLRIALDQIVEDAQMAGYDSDRPTSQIVIAQPVVPGDNQLTISYELDDTTERTVTYLLSGGQVLKQVTFTDPSGASTPGPPPPPEPLLDGALSLRFTYGLDTDNDGVADAWVPAGAVGTARLVAIRVRLSARPTHPDFTNVLSRELESIATLRNRIL